MQPTLELSDVSAHYGQVQVLYSVNMRAMTGEITALLGPNGAGKTTTLRVAAGLMAPSTGRVVFEGKDVTRRSARQRTKAGVCLIPEGRGIFPDLTVSENLRLHSYLKPMRIKEVEEKTFAIFPRLADRRGQLAGTLSGGEQQMLALSRALTTEPEILLLDELSMGLAPNLVDDLFRVVQGLAEAGRTIVIVEQLVEYALELAHHVIVLARGRIAAEGGPGEVRASLADVYMGEWQSV
jgi:branched-chain amino acid transport system ATP-binding protein